MQEAELGFLGSLSVKVDRELNLDGSTHCLGTQFQDVLHDGSEGKGIVFEDAVERNYLVSRTSDTLRNRSCFPVIGACDIPKRLGVLFGFIQIE